MPCKTIDALSGSAEFSVEIDETGLPAVEYVEYPSSENKNQKKNKNGHTYPNGGSMTEKTAEDKGSLTLLFESAEKGKDGRISDYAEEESVPENNEPFVPETEPAQSNTGALEEYDTDNDIYSYSDYRRCFQSCGIVYDVAEEIYRRERTSAEIEALEQPPFRKVLDAETMDKLNAQAEERTRKLYSVKRKAGSRAEQSETAHEQKTSVRRFSTLKALALQILFLIPIVNVFSAMALSFGSRTDKSIRAYARGYMILSLVFISAALGYIIYSSLSDPDNDFITRLISLFE